MVYSPPVLLLDEPLSNLDAKLREDARAWLRQIIKQNGTSALYVTHDQTEALAIAVRTLLLDRGRIQQEGTPQEIYGAPTNRFTAEFMGSNNSFNGKIAEISGERARLQVNGWSLWGRLRSPKRVGDDATGLIRVERTRLGNGTSELKLKLTSSLYLGERWEYLFHNGDLRVRVWGEERLPEGDYALSVPENSLWIF